MSVESELVTALSTLDVPVARLLYTGRQDVYITYSGWTAPSAHADNAPRLERHFFYVNLYAPATTNTTALQALMKTALVNGGFSYPTSQAVDDDDENWRVAFETFKLSRIGEG